MSSREVFFLLGADGEILYRDEGTSPTYIPDSRDRWEAIGRARERLSEIPGRRDPASAIHALTPSPGPRTRAYVVTAVLICAVAVMVAAYFLAR